MSFNSLSIRSFGFGIEMNKLFKIGNSKVLITVILPNGVKTLRFHNLIKLLIFAIYVCSFNLYLI